MAGMVLWRTIGYLTVNASERLSARRFNSGMQQACINCMAERAVDKAGGVKGLPPEAVGA